MIEAHKKEGESSSSLLYRFSKKVKQSGVLREARKRRFRGRTVNRRKRRISAQYRAGKRQELDRLKKLGRA
jgi:ribosomal protein S21